MSSVEEFHQSIAAQLNHFHSQRTDKRDNVISSLVAENAALRAQLKLQVELRPIPLQETVAPLASHPQDPWMFGCPQNRGASSSTQKADMQQIQEQVIGSSDVSLAPLSTKKEEKYSGDDKNLPESLKEDLKIRNLEFLAEDATIIHSSSMFERCCPVLHTLYLCLGRVLWEPLDGPLARFVQGNCFKTISSLMITMNFAFIWVQTDYKMTHRNEDEAFVLVFIGYFFNSFYLIELVLNMAVYGKQWLLGEEVGWNLFDFGIVLVSLVELGYKAFGAKLVNTSFLRIIRFLRISRVLRMFSAMRMLKEIKIMIDTLSGSFTLFCYCTVLFSLYLSLFAIFFVQGATNRLEDGTAISQELSQHLQDNWGSVALAMRSLFTALTGGVDWSDLYSEVQNIGWVYDGLFLVFILFSYIAFTNVMTSVFCEKAMRLAKPCMSELTAVRQEVQLSDSKELLQLLRRFMEDTYTSAINAKTFELFMQNPEVETYFEVRGLSPSSAHRFFRVLCEVNQTDEVPVNTFISACVKLDAQASNIDVYCLSGRQLHGLHVIQAAQKSQYDDMKAALKHVADQIQTLKQKQYESPVCNLTPLKSDVQKEVAAVKLNSSPCPSEEKTGSKMHIRTHL